LGIRTPFLSIIAGLLLLSVTEARGGRAGCLRCHKPHYSAKGTCTGCHRGDERSDRLAIAHRDLIGARFSWFGVAGSQPLQRGEKLLDSFACRRCHTTAGKGNRLASNLDSLPVNSTPENIYQAIKSQALFMPDFRFDDRQMTDLVNAILAGALKAGRKGGETPQVVHFEDGKRNVENIFEKKCGPCHRVLTQAFGALGKGDIGPDLSGIFSEHYPATSKDKGSWTEATLKKWLENPRNVREESPMRPITLKKEEFERLLAVLANRAGR